MTDDETSIVLSSEVVDNGREARHSQQLQLNPGLGQN